MKPVPIEERTTQVRVRKNNIVMGASYPAIMFVTPTLARQLHAANAVDIIGSPLIPGPSENQMKEPSEKKFSDAPTNGPLIDSASSNPSGQEQLSRSLEGGQASSPSTSSLSSSAEQSGGGEPSPSTTPTSAPLGQTSSTSPTTAGGRTSGTGRGRSSSRSRG